MKRLLSVLFLAFSIIALNAQNNEKVYVYGIDYSYAKVYAADESVEQFAAAFESINMLIISEPDKYDFSRILGKRVNVVLEPVLKIVSSCDYADLKTLNNSYEEPEYTEIVKNYELPQTEGLGCILVAKVLDKPMGKASYELITFDIATREILTEREVSGKAGGFGLRNYWAGSVYHVIKKVKLYK